jgi:hypothetical protein
LWINCEWQVRHKQIEEKLLKVPHYFDHFVTDGTWQRIVNVADALAPTVAAHFGEGRSGGVITLYSEIVVAKQSARGKRHLGVHIQSEIGTPDPTKIGKYYVISLEKAARAARLRSDNSWNAERNPELLQYGGATRIPLLSLYLSFSGWKEIDDIVFCAYVLWRAEVIRREDVDEVFRRHEGISLELMERWEDYETALEAVSI